jgi:hypothetical protein
MAMAAAQHDVSLGCGIKGTLYWMDTVGIGHLLLMYAEYDSGIS